MLLSWTKPSRKQSFRWPQKRWKSLVHPLESAIRSQEWKETSRSSMSTARQICWPPRWRVLWTPHSALERTTQLCWQISQDCVPKTWVQKHFDVANNFSYIVIFQLSISGWWQLKYFLFSALFGEDSHYFSKGLKPPTCIVIFQPSIFFGVRFREGREFLLEIYTTWSSNWQQK